MCFVEVACDAESVFDGVHGIKDEVMEELFTHVFPAVFLRVEVGALRWELDNHHIGGNVEHAWAVTGRAVIDNEQEMLGVTFGEFLQEHVHAHAIHGGENEVARCAVLRTNGSIGIGVFAHNLRRNIGATALRCPAILRFVDASEPCFVLKKQLERQVQRRGFFFCFRNDRWPVFLKASCASGSPCGWRGRGVILRQPCRCSRL